MATTRITAKMIANYLASCTSSKQNGCAPGTGLSGVHKTVFKHANNHLKAKLEKDLLDFYKDKQNIINLWNELSDCERDFITPVVQCNGQEKLPLTIKCAGKYNIPLKKKDRWGYEKSILDEYKYLSFLHILKKQNPKTKAVALCPNGKEMPPFVVNVLKEIVEPLEFPFEEYVENKKNITICREYRVNDFAAVVRWVTCERVKVKQDTFHPTKPKLTKMVERIGFDEVCDAGGKFATPKEVARIEKFRVALPLFVLSGVSGLIKADYEDLISPGEKSVELLSLPHHILMKKIFNSYVSENVICEFDYVENISVYEGYHRSKWHLCRQSLIELLKKCPGEKFIKFENFLDFAKLLSEDFIKKSVQVSVVSYNIDFRYGGYISDVADWEECEVQFIRVFFSFLSALGILDIAYTQKVPRKTNDYDEEHCAYYVGIAGFRITKLGMWILGLSSNYEPQSPRVDFEEGELLVLPDYSVMISGIRCRIEHERFLSNYLTKVSDDDHVAVYKIDFKSIVRAHEDEVEPRHLKDFLEKTSNKPLPENVVRSLDDWQAKVGRVKIRTVTVIEADTPFLLEEIKHIKSVSKIIGDDLTSAVIIDTDKVKSLKKAIENNGWLVKL